MRTLYLIYLLAAELIFFVFSYVAGIFIVLTLGFFDPIGLSLEIIGGFIVISLFRNYIWRRLILKKHHQRWRQVIIKFIIFFVLLQVFLSVTGPISSLIPKTILSRAGLVYFLKEKTYCGVNQEIEKVKSLWGNRIDYKKINLVQGGLMSNLNLLKEKGIFKEAKLRGAMAIGNTIYFTDISGCPTSYVYFHEMTHIWQFQKEHDYLFGLNPIPFWIKSFYLQVKDPEILYDYGGKDGLRRARDENKHFLDFGIEQQATIVEDWYLVKEGYIWFDREEYKEYKELLEYFVSDMLTI